MRTLSRFVRWITSTILVALGFSACNKDNDEDMILMYGTPTASYSIKAKVLDSKQKPITEIKVKASIVLSDDVHFPIDSVYTNTAGEALFEFGGLYQKIKIECEDVDGDVNGNFESKTAIIKFENSDFKDADGAWYRGKVEKDITVEMYAKKSEE